jgi:hypothetical protein
VRVITGWHGQCTGAGHEGENVKKPTKRKLLLEREVVKTLSDLHGAGLQAVRSGQAFLSQQHCSDAEHSCWPPAQSFG